MPAIQIYPAVNQIANNIGYTGDTVVDVTTFVAFANAALSGMKESVYNKMYDLIGRTMIAIDEAKEDERKIIVDSFEYGSILQKISFQNQDAESSSEWDIQNPENPYSETVKDGVIVEYFENRIPTFSWKDVQYDVQLREAFRSPESLMGFMDGKFQRMRNAYTQAKNGLSDAAIGALVATVNNATSAQNPARRVRHLMTEYNTLSGKSLTSANSYLDQDYLEYIRKTIIIDKANLDRMTKLYNTGTVERRTSEEDLALDLSLAVTSSFAKFWGDTYNETFVKLPKHNEVVNWGIATAPDTVKVSLDGGTTTTTVANIIGLMRDKDAVVATMDRSRFVNFYDQWNDRNCFKLTANRRYICDPSENAILYLND